MRSLTPMEKKRLRNCTIQDNFLLDFLTETYEAELTMLPRASGATLQVAQGRVQVLQDILKTIQEVKNYE